MIKKDYMKPAMTVVTLQHQTHILAGSFQGVQANGLDDDDLDYDSNGGDQGSAW